MTATDSLHPQQLRMFMTPREILKTHSPLDADRLRQPGSPGQYLTGEKDDKKVWRRKAAESTVGRAENTQHQGVSDNFPSLHESVAAHGVQEPIGLGQATSDVTGKPMLTGGHHRAATAFVTNPDQFIPVAHFADVEAHQKDPQYGGKRYH